MGVAGLDLTAGEYYLSGYLLDESCEQVLGSQYQQLMSAYQ